MLFNLILVSSIMAIVQAMPQFVDPISCLKPGQIATATWTARGKTCTWTGTVGSNFGANTANGGKYVSLISSSHQGVYIKMLTCTTLLTVMAATGGNYFIP